jgi:BirA family biotin operon repressor/biotin-[acetyl-CoA-carboxylase] ligase
MAPANLPDGYRRLAFERLGSTNAEALAHARAGDPGRLWVTAEEQTQGRGRRGRVWRSGMGNHHASLLLVDAAPRETAATLSFAAGVALHRALTGLAGESAGRRLKLKWPNDLLCDGQKVAGLLVEGEELPNGSFGVVTGIGVNCVSHPEIEALYPAGDLAALGIRVDAEELFLTLARSFDEEIRIWDAGRGFAAVRKRWVDRALGFGGPIRVNLPDRTIHGRLETLDQGGRLIVVSDDGRRETVSAGDIFFGVASG